MITAPDRQPALTRTSRVGVQLGVGRAITPLRTRIELA